MKLDLCSLSQKKGNAEESVLNKILCISEKPSGDFLVFLKTVLTRTSAPTTFGNILSQSGAFWWNLEEEEEAEWLTKQYAAQEKLPLRWYLDVGSLEEEPVCSMVTVNRHLRDVLRAESYSVQYAEFSGGHEYLSWRGTLAEGLLALMAKKKAGRGNN